jgi:hypothetical protein
MAIIVHRSLNHGYNLSIAGLRRVLADISHGSRRWWNENNVTLLRDPDVADALPLQSCARSNDRRDQLSGAGVAEQRGPMKEYLWVTTGLRYRHRRTSKR